MQTVKSIAEKIVLRFAVAGIVALPVQNASAQSGTEDPGVKKFLDTEP